MVCISRTRLICQELAPLCLVGLGQLVLSKKAAILVRPVQVLAHPSIGPNRAIVFSDADICSPNWLILVSTAIFVSVRSGELLHLETILVWGSVLSEDTIFSLYCILNGGTIEQIVL